MASQNPNTPFEGLTPDDQAALPGMEEIAGETADERNAKIEAEKEKLRREQWAVRHANAKKKLVDAFLDTCISWWEVGGRSIPIEAIIVEHAMSYDSMKDLLTGVLVEYNKRPRP